MTTVDWIIVAFAILLAAQAGVPLTTGFLAKFAVIKAATSEDDYSLAIIAMLVTAVAAFFYLRLIVVMYMAENQTMAGVGPQTSSAAAGGDGGVATAVVTRVEIPVAAAIAIGLCLAFTVGAGLLPQPVIDFARHATLLRL